MLLYLAAPFLTVATLWVLWYAIKKFNPNEVEDPQFFLDSNPRDFFVRHADLLRIGRHNLQRYGCTIRLADGIAFGGILPGDSASNSYLYRPIGVAMEALAQTVIRQRGI
jgi:hypothetical protein